MFREMAVQGPRLGPVATSVIVHACVFTLAIFGPRATSESKPKSLFDTVFKPNEKKLIWYRFGTKLPEVTPSQTQANKPARVVQPNKNQTIVTQGDRGKTQMTLRDAPELKQQAELKAPNLLAFEAPKVEPPPRPKQFEAPKLPPVPRPEPQMAELPPAPELRENIAGRKSLLPDPQRPAPRKFEAPQEQARRRQQELELANAPELASENLRRESLLPGPDAPKRPVKAFVAPAAKPVEQAKLTLPSAPDLKGGEAKNLFPVDIARPSPRKFDAPAARAAKPVERPELAVNNAPRLDPSNPLQNGAALPSEGAPVPRRPDPKRFEAPGQAAPRPGQAQVIDVGDGPPDVTGNDPLTAAVISPTPVNIPTPVLPEGNRRAGISAGPKPNADGADSEPVRSARVNMPGLTIRDPGQAPPPPPRSLIPTAMVQVAPTSQENLRAVARAVVSSRQPEPSETAPSDLPGIQVASTPPASYLRGRTVYSMSIQAPNVTSYSGSWLVWFAEKSSQGPGLRPPGAIRKVDPVYPPAAMDERVQGKVRLAGVILPDGTVSQISVVSGVDDRLDQSAITAFSKWLFEPGLRDGQPVELDVVVEIPFRLAPRDPAK